ncbi:MAG: hypothetical protein NC394_07640 [Bacteroides sp.]|nr:hypothetical protein [Bacteroides sp.]
MREMIYTFAILTVCFLSCIFKVGFFLSGEYFGVVELYILTTFTLFFCAVLLYIFIGSKCREYIKNPQKETFLTIKRLKNASELVYTAVIIFFVTSIFDIFNAKYVGDVFKDTAVLFTSYPLYEVLFGAGVIVFGFKTYMRFYDANKIFSALEAEVLKKRPESVYELTKQYPTFEEYERGIMSGSAAREPAVRAGKSQNTEQDRFLKEHEVPIDDIEKRLTGLESRIRNGKTVYSKFDYGSTPSGDNSLNACPFCGSLNTAESSECSFCGAKLK